MGGSGASHILDILAGAKLGQITLPLIGWVVNGVGRIREISNGAI